MPDDVIPCRMTFGEIPLSGATALQLATFEPSGAPVVLSRPFLPPESWYAWSGYRLEVFGRWLHTEPHDYLAQIWWFPPNIIDSLRILELWERRAFHRRSPLYAELTWKPGWQEPRPLIAGLSRQPPGTTAVQRLWRGLDLLYEIGAAFEWSSISESSRRPGRAGEYDEGNQHVFEALLKDAIGQCVKERFPANPSQLERRMPHKAETITHYIEKFRIDLEAWERDAIEKAWRD